MGEAVVSSEMELEFQETEVAQLADGGAAAADEGADVGWKKFLPKMAVRVLLVEADDCTRQIIAALLRKCSYRVAAVADGLKAWELLKGKPHNIDLILTEVELPSISGYALLSLIMEHDACKNIPVIMMSWQDSMSTVYKCMLRGAADFLVKPVRKNELRNLWQHVWRKQISTSAAGLGPPEDSPPQQKVEATAENNGTSNHSSGYIACVKRNRECMEKGSDAQSSSKPELEKEGADIERVNYHSEPNIVISLSDDSNINTQQEECHQESRETRALEQENLDNAENEDNNNNINNVDEDCSRVAVDLMGACDNYLKGNFGSLPTNVSTNKFLQLDLSLRRSNPDGTLTQVNDEGDMLNHSGGSAFSRYINNKKDQESDSGKQQPYNHTPDCNSDTHDPTITFSCPQKRDISLPILVKRVRYENVINNDATYGSLMPQMSNLPSSSLQFHNLMDQRINNAIDQIDDKQGQKLENVEDQDLDRDGVSTENYEQSGNSNLCCGKINSVVTSECGNVEGASNRSIREAALMKFRLKRKDRCFDKKVRYESRKKLAEQRPRVKGQFVRQVPNDSQTENSSLA